MPVADEVTHFIERHQRVYVIEQNRDGQVAALLRSALPGALADRLHALRHYNGTPLAAENVVRPILGWEKSPHGPGWPTGDPDLDNPDVPHAGVDAGVNLIASHIGRHRSIAVAPARPVPLQ